MKQHNESAATVELQTTEKIKKMPEGKQQFGIIVPISIHREARQLALDMECRISDVYATGVEKLLAELNPGEDVPSLTKGLSKAQKVYVDALLDFLDSDPDESRMSMLRLILGKHMPKEAVDIRSRGKKKHA